MQKPAEPTVSGTDRERKQNADFYRFINNSCGNRNLQQTVPNVSVIDLLVCACANNSLPRGTSQLGNLVS